MSSRIHIAAVVLVPAKPTAFGRETLKGYAVPACRCIFSRPEGAKRE